MTGRHIDAGMSSSQLCAAATVTYRRLHYWRQLGLLRPSIHAAVGSGDNDRWSDDDLHALRVVARIMDQTGSAEVAANALALVRSEDGRWLICAHDTAIVVGDGNLEELLAETGGGTVIDLRPQDAVA